MVFDIWSTVSVLLVSFLLNTDLPYVKRLQICVSENLDLPVSVSVSGLRSSHSLSYTNLHISKIMFVSQLFTKSLNINTLWYLHRKEIQTVSIDTVIRGCCIILHRIALNWIVSYRIILHCVVLFRVVSIFSQMPYICHPFFSVLDKISCDNELVQRIPAGRIAVTLLLVTMSWLRGHAVLYHCEIDNQRKTFIKGKWPALGLCEY